MRRVPIYLTFIEGREEGPHAEHLLDELQLRLGRTGAALLRDDSPIPVHFQDDRPETEQRRFVRAALDAVDEAEKRQPGDWQNTLP